MGASPFAAFAGCRAGTESVLLDIVLCSKILIGSAGLGGLCLSQGKGISSVALHHQISMLDWIYTTRQHQITIAFVLEMQYQRL